MRTRSRWSVAPVVVLLAGCGGGTPDEAPLSTEGAVAADTAEEDGAAAVPSRDPDGPAPTADAPSDGFCAAIAEAGDDLDLLDEGRFTEAMAEDPLAAFTRAAAAAAAIEPPDDLATDWAVLVDVAGAYATALSEADVDLDAALAEVAATRPPSDFEALARVGLEVELRCGARGEVTDVAAALCAAVPAGALEEVFAGAVPEAEPTDHGAGFAECIWAVDDAAEVRVSVLPLDDLTTDYLAHVEGAQALPELEDGVGFPGVTGIGRASRGGWTVAFASGETGVMVAVRAGARGTGGEGADEDAATAIATVVAGTIPAVTTAPD